VNRKPDQPPKYSLHHHPKAARGFSPYRLLNFEGTEVQEVNAFLDAQAVYGLSPRSLRAYGFSLLNFWRWLQSVAKKTLGELVEVDLFDYVRFQKNNPARENTEVNPKTINLRLTAVRCLYRFHFGRDLPAGSGSFRAPTHRFFRHARWSIGCHNLARPRTAQVRVKVPRQVVVPLTVEEVHQFLKSLRWWRDLLIVALMLFCGLRSREILEALIPDIDLTAGQIRIRGKGGKERVVPLPPQIVLLIKSYMEIERPPVASENLFLVLKGSKRGQPMTVAGLRTLFRYHRLTAKVPKANPHRFRHTFGADMARAGISLPALMKLMGHADIKTTMIYVELSPKDVWEEFQRVIRNMHREKLIPRGDCHEG
jgi:integrase